MRQCLMHPVHGYYTNKQAFGRSGDFITSPEISQVFGELIGVWCVHMWEKMGKPKIKIIELGPGKGTLIADLLRISTKFPDFQKSLSLHLIEISILNIQQQQKKVSFVHIDEPDDFVLAETKLFRLKETRTGVNEGDKIFLHGRCAAHGGVPISWYQDINDVPDGPSLIIAQEFFDALPVFQFLKTERGWVEKVVDAEVADEAPHYLRFVATKEITPVAKVLLSRLQIQTDDAPPIGKEIGVNARVEQEVEVFVRFYFILIYVALQKEKQLLKKYPYGSRRMEVLP